MNTIALAILLLIRLIIPVSALIAFGEWMRRREVKHWLSR